MNKLENITATKEYELAQQVERGINSYSFDPKVFAACVPCFHRTLQQTFWRTIVACIKLYASDSYGYDLRNKASHEEAQVIMEYLKENERPKPMI